MNSTVTTDRIFYGTTRIV